MRGDYEDRLTEIEARLNAATPGPWKADTGVRGDCVVFGPNGRFVGNMQAEPHWVEYPDETRSVAFDVDRRDCEFIANAPVDTAYLIAEVRRMRSEQNPNQAAKYWREIQGLRRENHDFRDRLERARNIAYEASEQPNDYDEDTEAEIALGQEILAVLRGVS